MFLRNSKIFVISTLLLFYKKDLPFGDINFKEYFTLSSKAKHNTKSEVIEDFGIFLSQFYKSGTIWNCTKDRLTLKYHPKVIPLDKMIKELKRNGLIFEYSSPKGILSYDVPENLKYTIVKYLANGTNSYNIQQVLNDLIQKYK